MTERESAATTTLSARTALLGGAAILTAAIVLLAVAPHRASATAAFTQQTGQPCTKCHVMPPSGDKLTPFGEQFKQNGNKVK